MKAFSFGASIFLAASVLFLTQCGRLAGDGEDGVDAAPAQCPIWSSPPETTSCDLPNETPCDFAVGRGCSGMKRWICKDGQWNDEASRVRSPGGATPCPDTEADDDAGEGGD